MSEGVNTILHEFCLSKNEKRISYCDINKLFKLYKPEEILEFKDNKITKLDLNHYKPEKFKFIGKFLTNDVFLHNSLIIIHTCGKVGTLTLVSNLNKYDISNTSTNHNFYILEQLLNQNKNKVITIISGQIEVKSYIVSAFLQNIFKGKLLPIFIEQYDSSDNCFINLFNKYKSLFEGTYNEWWSKYFKLTNYSDYFLKNKNYDIFKYNNINFHLYKIEELNNYITNELLINDIIITNTSSEKNIMNTELIKELLLFGIPGWNDTDSSEDLKNNKDKNNDIKLHSSWKKLFIDNKDVNINTCVNNINKYSVDNNLIFDSTKIKNILKKNN